MSDGRIHRSAAEGFERAGTADYEKGRPTYPRAVLDTLFPGATVLEGTAEDLPVLEQSVDLLTVAQAWHWFDPVPALDEISRALRSGGWLALVWNTRHPDDPWTDAINGVLDRLAGDTPRFRSRDRRWRKPIEQHPAFAGELHEAAFDNPVTMDLETMLARVSSTSYVSALPDGERAAVLDEVAELVRSGPMAEQGPQFVERYRTELFWCRRR